MASIGGYYAPGYDWVSQHVSELGPLNGLPLLFERFAAAGTGLFFILFAVGLWFKSDIKFPVGIWFWIIFGLSMISNGIWLMGSQMHGLYGVGIVNLIAAALTTLEVPQLRNSKKFYVFTAAVSMLGIIYLWLNLTGLDPQEYRGLTQRLFSSINSLWPFVASLFLLRVTDNS